MASSRSWEVLTPGGYRTNSPQFTWSDFEATASGLAHCGAAGCSESGGYKVYVIDQGGFAASGEDNSCHVSYRTTEVAPNTGSSDGDMTLVVFWGAGTVCLTDPWGPSVLAPYARIVATRGDLDGCTWAKSLGDIFIRPTDPVDIGGNCYAGAC